MYDQKQKPDQAQNQTAHARLTKEQLKGLLNDFLDQLIASTPPAIMDQQVSMNQQPKGPTVDELHQAWLEGGDKKVGKIMMRADGSRMVPSPQDLTLAYQKGGGDLLGALMANMDEEEPDNSEPEWDERRWR